MDEKWSSRKLWVVIIQFLVLLVLPPLYKYLELSESTLMVVLGSSSGLASIYLGVNILQKKIMTSVDDGSV